MSADKVPEWVTYPGAAWVEITPKEAGLDVAAWRHLLTDLDVRGASYEGEVSEAHDWGTVFTRGGYLVHTWGNGDYRAQTASVGKAFTWAVLGLAVERGLVDAEDRICKTWTGEGQLSHPHKYLDRGHHRTLTWSLLGRKVKGGYWGGFPVTNGYYWRQGPTSQGARSAIRWVPEWADWTGDPSFDNYSHAEPGTKGIYSSGGQWRLAQALTVLWGKDLKRVLDDELFGEIGIPADRWDWTPGRAVREKRDWYPHMPGYGDFLDPPYEVDGRVVRGGPGWVVMSASDLARFGHLVATGGMWEGRRLLGRQWTIGHGGGNGSGVAGESTNYTAFGIVTTDGIDFRDPFFPDELFPGPVRVFE